MRKGKSSRAMPPCMEENRCIICGKKLKNPLAIYCPECEYELKRVRLADEESVEEWMERMGDEREKINLKGVKSLDFYFLPF